MKKVTTLAWAAAALALVACSSESTESSSDGPDASLDDDANGETDDDRGGSDDDLSDDESADDDTSPADDDAREPGEDDDLSGHDDVSQGDDDLDFPASDGGPDELPLVDAGDDDAPTNVEVDAPTYYQDALPIFEARCLGCHQEGGIGPFRLDDYETAAQFADLAKLYVAERIMPPFHLTDGEGCGDFQNSRWLSVEEIETIGAWADGGALEGEPREAVLPPLPTLDATEEVSTPEFTPEAEGSAMAEFDEYRCFLLDRRTVEEFEFLTGYEVDPGNPQIVHHVTVSLVNENQASDVENPDTGEPYTNGELMARLDAESPEREGWPCYSGAGDGVKVGQLPIVWAPGGGALTFPDDSGMFFTPEDRMVVQVHYNLREPSTFGQSAQTRIRLQMSSIVTKVAIFFPIDPLLDSVGGDELTLEPGQEDVEVSWTMPIADTPVGNFEGLELWGVYPHMHELGRDFSFNATIGGADMCLADMTFWDFHWQLAYFYEQGLPVTSTDLLSASCHYDTSERTEPVLPGWGTQNEMCFTGLLFTAPVLAVAEALGL